MKQVQVLRYAAAGTCLRFDGQTGQFQYSNCLFGHANPDNRQGTNIHHGPGSIQHFHSVTSIQNSRKGFYGENVTDITFVNGFFENMVEAFEWEIACHGNAIRSSLFGNAGFSGILDDEKQIVDQGNGTGYILKVGSSAAVTFDSNFIGGYYDRLIVADNPLQVPVFGNSIGGLNHHGNSADSLTTGIIQQRSVNTSGFIPTDEHSLILVNHSATVIQTIRSSLLPDRHSCCAHMTALSRSATVATSIWVMPRARTPFRPIARCCSSEPIFRA
jgi:hypothetical protein